MSDCVKRACCVFHRGEVFLREIGGTVFRSVGNSSQLRIDHAEDPLELLSATALDECCGLVGVALQLVLKCADDANLGLGLGGTPTQVPWQSGSRVFNIGRQLLPGEFLSLDMMVTPSTVVLAGVPASAWTATAGGVRIEECLPAGAYTVTYSRNPVTSIAAGASCDKDFELLYLGKNMFDNSSVRLRVPRVRLKQVKGFDWINASDASELALEGRVIFSQNVWYEVQRFTEDVC